MSEFTHLHLHTEYSLLDGANKIGELAQTLKERGAGAVAITDHGNMFGAIDFYKTMKANGIKPIIGMEAYIHNHDDISDTSDKARFHLILLAKNEIGYKNLAFLSSQAYINGFYYYPRINKKLLREHSEGLVCSSACLQGEVSFHLNLSERNLKRGAKGYERAKEVALEYKEIFGDDFYLEIMRHGIEDQFNIDDDLIRISKETGIKIIATNDSHYTFKERAVAQDAFMCIAMGTTLNDEKRMKHTVHEFYVKTDEEMKALFADIPEAIQNTQEIVEKCNLSFAFDDKNYAPTPPNFKFALEYAAKKNLELPNPNERYNKENDDYLFENSCKEGLKERLKFIPQEKHENYYKRLEIELEIIKKMGFSGYMMIVQDFINWAKDNDIPVGPGRGSAAGSLCAYALRITDLDPLPYNLLFERFLNPSRISMPDIDVDFCQARRGEVIDYVIKQYGKENVAQVATFGKLLARGVIRDVARVCDMPLREADAMAKLVPESTSASKITLMGEGEGDKFKPGAYQLEPKLAELIASNPMAKQVWDYALALEGLNRNAGMHAAGVVISNEPLWNKAPLFRQSKGDDGHYVTQYTKNYLEDVDLIKFDFLGLKNLDVIDNAMKLVKRRYGVDIVWEKIDFNDPKTYETIQCGNTLGIFQIESSGMQELASSLKPDCFEDIIAMISLYRPGPMDLIPDFIARKHGAKIEYLMPEIKEILEPTYGIIVYQEQVMQIVQKVGGFSLGDADLVRRAMGKKDEKKLAHMRSQYLEGAEKNGFDTKKADELFDMIMKFASYGFNKSHAAAYSMITFQTAYLKSYYPAEFMSALITSEEGNTDKIVKYIDEAKRLGIGLLPPSINQSFREFYVVDDENASSGKSIIYGLGAIKGVGEGAIENIIELREESPFSGIDDFAYRVDNFRVNKKVIESLVYGGAMDCLGKTRLSIIQNIENILDTMKKNATIKKEALNSLFGAEDTAKPEVKFVENESEYPTKELLKFEQQAVGIYLSGHPLQDYESDIKASKCTMSSEFEELGESAEVLCIGKIEDLSTRITKSGKKMGIVTILDLHGSFEAVVFDQMLTQIEMIQKAGELDNPHGFRLRVSKNATGGSNLSISLNQILSFEEAKTGEFKAKTFKKSSGNYAEKRNANPQPKRVQTVDFEFEIELSNLNRDKINRIYKLAFADKNPQNTKKLILRIRDKNEVFVYDTKFIVGDDFSDKIQEILAA